ncbi:prostaglandin reductase 1 [Leptinotarsa decemlineata]|uniref:prostaglandin reductase 1 n=1 Tax=Leptinotarsa decemlineata TaxID=7539 RepID=UPI000C2542AC|nr:prostaglandin reductase 1-like [Leptinotarsa decemlineata]
MAVAHKFVFQKHFDGFPKESDFKLEKEDLPIPNDGEFLAEAVYLSVDPYMRPYSRALPIGSTFMGSQIARITESKNSKYPIGKYVIGNFGWRTHTISDGKLGEPMILPDFGKLPLSLGLGVLGMTGATAYFGFLEICKPKKGETVVVSGAAGAVGSHVGQIAKIKGCTVIGITGSDEKGKWLVDELGFDHFINYKTTDLEKVLPEVAPNGIDCYFDNVGGDISSTVIYQMNHFGRIAVCGAISGYNEGEKQDVIIQFPVTFRQLRMEGFIVSRWNERRMEAIKQNLEWIEQGKLKYQETITNGFENMFKAFYDMLNGGNVGKALVKV